ncbi:MAG TPA: DUF494 family protein [Candidatus Hydrogenedentes bacterium]|nr:DUF494 family protein [Candidatus Hydrogenedentota bacterium]HPG65835.1 DUF494 family protein [Candidatus Hydrogenedentota bacterium]
MKPQITELVDVILHIIQEYPENSLTETTVRSWLSNRGYKKRDIEAAMKLVKPRFASCKPTPVHRPASIRTLSPREQQQLSPEARNALARLELYGLLSPSERELILHHLDHFEGEVGVDELDYLLSWLICGDRNVEFQQTVANTLDDNLRGLH